MPAESPWGILGATLGIRTPIPRFTVSTIQPIILDGPYKIYNKYLVHCSVTHFVSMVPKASLPIMHLHHNGAHAYYIFGCLVGYDPTTCGTTIRRSANWAIGTIYNRFR